MMIVETPHFQPAQCIFTGYTAKPGRRFVDPDINIDVDHWVGRVYVADAWVREAAQKLGLFDEVAGPLRERIAELEAALAAAEETAAEAYAAAEALSALMARPVTVKPASEAPAKKPRLTKETAA